MTNYQLAKMQNTTSLRRLLATSQGNSFDGIFINPVVGSTVWGELYISNKVDTGGVIHETSMICHLGNIPSSGDYVETENGGRYLIVGVSKERLDSLDEWLINAEEQIGTRRWSN